MSTIAPLLAALEKRGRMTKKMKAHFLFRQGLKLGQIADALQVSYQQVYRAVGGPAGRKVVEDDLPRCRVCGRVLSDADSIADGIGPICYHRDEAAA